MLLLFLLLLIFLLVWQTSWRWVERWWLHRIWRKWSLLFELQHVPLPPLSLSSLFPQFNTGSAPPPPPPLLQLALKLLLPLLCPSITRVGSAFIRLGDVNGIATMLGATDVERWWESETGCWWWRGWRRRDDIVLPLFLIYSVTGMKKESKRMTIKNGRYENVEENQKRREGETRKISDNWCWNSRALTTTSPPLQHPTRLVLRCTLSSCYLATIIGTKHPAVNTTSSRITRLITFKPVGVRGTSGFPYLWHSLSAFSLAGKKNKINCGWFVVA